MKKLVIFLLIIVLAFAGFVVFGTGILGSLLILMGG